jgi:hypothetical protein
MGLAAPVAGGGAQRHRTLETTFCLLVPAVAASPLGRAYGLYTGAALGWAQGDVDEALAMLQDCLVLRRAVGTAVARRASEGRAVVRAMLNADGQVCALSGRSSSERQHCLGHLPPEIVRRSTPDGP